jgi:hypothetical protein
MIVLARGLPVRLSLAVAALVVAGCGSSHLSSMFNAAAPLSPGVNFCCLS